MLFYKWPESVEQYNMVGGSFVALISGTIAQPCILHQAAIDVRKHRNTCVLTKLLNTKAMGQILPTIDLQSKNRDIEKEKQCFGVFFWKGREIN